MWRRNWMRLLPALTVCGVLSGCGGVTDRQLADFATTTGIRVVVQALSSIAESLILQNFGST